MTVIATYQRSNGSFSGNSPGSSGILISNRQKKPYKNGPYHTRKLFAEKSPYGTSDIKPTVYNATWHDNTWPANVVQEARALARRRLLRSLIHNRAAIGITAATANQSFAMIATRAGTLIKAAKAAKKLNVKAFARALGVLPKKNHRHSIRDPASLWLEYTFGWVPLVQDMYNAASVLSDPFEVVRSFGTATVTKTVSDSGYRYKRIVRKKARVVCTAGLRIDNPNIALLTQLGLSNPAAVVWDLVPFSFVVDWFMKINTYVNSWNDMAGFSFVDPVTTENVIVDGLYTWEGSVNWPIAYTNAAKGKSRRRVLEIVNQPPFPSFQLPAPSLWLAVTATALLVQIVGKGK